MKRKIGSSLLTLAAVAALSVINVRCKDWNTVTGPTVTGPTLAPAIDLTGTWTGTFSTTHSVLDDCVGAGPAEATFNQQGSTVNGNLSTTANCGVQGPLQGRVQGSVLSGAMAGGYAYSVTGVLTDGELHLTFAISGGGATKGRMTLKKTPS